MGHGVPPPEMQTLNNNKQNQTNHINVLNPNEELENVSKAKYLRVTIDKKLKWNTHVE